MQFRSKRLAAGAVVAIALAIPAMAFAGVRPPEGVQYEKSGTSNILFTQEDGDSNGTAEKADVSVAIYKCGNNVPFMLEGLEISDKGTFKFKGKAKNLAGQKSKLKLKGSFPKSNKAVEKVTITKGKCKKSQSVTLKAVR